MDVVVKKQLGEAVTEVFSTMYFLPAQVLDVLPEEDSWNSNEPFISAHITFSGPLNAAIRFFFPKKIAHTIAEGFLGLDEEEVTDGQLLDTMREAVNMVIGSFLGKVDPDGSCKLGIPEAELLENFSPNGMEGEGELMAIESEHGFLWMVYGG